MTTTSFADAFEPGIPLSIAKLTIKSYREPKCNPLFARNFIIEITTNRKAARKRKHWLRWKIVCLPAQEKKLAKHTKNMTLKIGTNLSNMSTHNNACCAVYGHLERRLINEPMCSKHIKMLPLIHMRNYEWDKIKTELHTMFSVNPRANTASYEEHSTKSYKRCNVLAGGTGFVYLTKKCTVTLVNQQAW